MAHRRKEWDGARALLSLDLQSSRSARDLEEEVTSLIEYAEDVLSQAEVITDMEDWPGKEEDDIGWAYVALAGETFSEAATVIVKREGVGLVIRSLEWGRP